jgi:hypothetical protein
MRFARVGYGKGGNIPLFAWFVHGFCMHHLAASPLPDLIARYQR